MENRKKSVYSEIDIKKAKKPAVAGPKDSSPEKGSHKYVVIGDITRLYIHYSDE